MSAFEVGTVLYAASYAPVISDRFQDLWVSGHQIVETFGLSTNLLGNGASDALKSIFDFLQDCQAFRWYATQQGEYSEKSAKFIEGI